MTGRTKSQQSIDSKILTAIKKRGPGVVFVPVEFLEFGSREGIDVALHRLTKEDVIRRLARGIRKEVTQMYGYPSITALFDACKKFIERNNKNPLKLINRLWLRFGLDPEVKKLGFSG